MENYRIVMELVYQLPANEGGIRDGDTLISILYKHNVISYYDRDLLMIWNRHRGD